MGQSQAQGEFMPGESVRGCATAIRAAVSSSRGGCPETRKEAVRARVTPPIQNGVDGRLDCGTHHGPGAASDLWDKGVTVKS